jgi:hypothetical protein
MICLVGGELVSASARGTEAQNRASLIIGEQVKAQAYTLTYSDAFTAITLVAACSIMLVALMRPMKRYFDSPENPSKK